MKLRGIIALAISLACGPAFAQVTPGTSPLSQAKGGTGSVGGAAIGIDARAFGMVCDGVTDDAAHLSAAFAAGPTVYVQASATKCVIKSQVVVTSSGGSAYNQGATLIGQGSEDGGTVFDNQVASNCMFLFQSPANFKFAAGITLQHFKVTSTTAPATSCGIELYRAAYANITDVEVNGITGRGVYVPASVGDADAAIQISLDRVRCFFCASGGGFAWDFSAPTGGYFGSNLKITNSNISGSGLVGTAANPPTSGGLVTKGLIMQLENNGFTINNGPDWYVQGTDTSVNITSIGNDFENNTSSTMPHIYVDAGLEGFVFVNNECLNNDSFKSQGCLWFNSATALQAQVQIGAGNMVRASTGNNPYVAFQATGGNTTIDTFQLNPTVYWQVFDGTGQTRFSGLNFPQISGQARFSVNGVNTQILSGAGAGFTIPLHLTATSEWVPYQVPTAGVTASIGPLTPATLYYFYLSNSAATNTPYVGLIEASTTAPTSAVPGGYFVKTGDSTRVLIGTATTDGGGNFQAAGIQASQYPAAPNISAVQGLGTGIAAALAINVGLFGAPVIMNGVLGTPSSGSAANLTLAANQVTRANLAQGVARSVIGVTGNATANVADIQGTANQFLGVNPAGTAVAFQSVRQIIPLSLNTVTLPQASTIFTVSLGNATETNVQAACPIGGTFRNLTLISTAPAAGQTLTGTWRVNNADTALVCTITGTGTTCGPINTAVTCTAGQSYSLKLVTSATTGTINFVSGGIEFDTP